MHGLRLLGFLLYLCFLLFHYIFQVNCDVLFVYNYSNPIQRRTIIEISDYNIHIINYISYLSRRFIILETCQVCYTTVTLFLEMWPYNFCTFRKTINVFSYLNYYVVSFQRLIFIHTHRSHPPYTWFTCSQRLLC